MSKRLKVFCRFVVGFAVCVGGCSNSEDMPATGQGDAAVFVADHLCEDAGSVDVGAFDGGTADAGLGSGPMRLDYVQFGAERFEYTWDEMGRLREVERRGHPLRLIYTGMRLDRLEAVDEHGRPLVEHRFSYAGTATVPEQYVRVSYAYTSTPTGPPRFVSTTSTRTFTYDASGRLETVTRGERVTHFVYDGQGRLEHVRTSSRSNGPVLDVGTFRYASGRLESSRDWQYEYDAQGRMNAVTEITRGSPTIFDVRRPDERTVELLGLDREYAYYSKWGFEPGPSNVAFTFPLEDYPAVGFDGRPLTGAMVWTNYLIFIGDAPW